MTEQDDFDFDGFGEAPDDGEPAAGAARGGEAGGGNGSGRERDWDDDWEELDWDQLGPEDLGYEPDDAERVRQAWRKASGRFRRDDLPSVVRMFDLLSELAGDALPPDARRQLERALRELLVVVRDALDRAIERLDEAELDTEIEEIPIE